MKPEDMELVSLEDIVTGKIATIYEGPPGLFAFIILNSH